MEGAEVEIFPSSLTLPGGSEKSQFVLVSIPRATGEITVPGNRVVHGSHHARCLTSSGRVPLSPGYEAEVFGVYHKCDVKISGNPIIRVVSKLPQLGVRSFPALSTEGGVALEVVTGGRRASKAGLEKFDLLDGER